MYDENVTYKIGFNWKSLLVKIVLFILFILFLVWLFPKNDLTVFYDKIYSENIQTMKEAARNYYTTDRLPANVGDSTKMTLKQMFDNKMLIKFKDKDNNYCDETASYVEVTKSGENEYVLKVQLNCGDQKDYILETIGCNDVCPQGKCEEQIAVDTTPETPSEKEDDTNEELFTTTTTYYRHRKAIVTSNTVFTCPAGYTLNGSKCTKQTIGATIEATKHYKEDQTITTDAKVNTGDEYIEYTNLIKTKIDTEYSCPEGYTLNGSYCIKYTDPIENKGEIYYVCPEGYTLNGQTCTKTYDAKYTEGKTTYTCPSGYTLSGTKCVAQTNATTSTNYTCPSGYTKNGTSCYKVSDATSKTTYTCPAGYTLSGTKCTKTTTDTKDATPSTTYGSWKHADTKYYTEANKAYTGTTSKLVYEGMITGAVCGEPCGNKGIWYKYSYYTRSANTTYTCPEGYTLSGTKCTKSTTDTKDATPNTKLTCPSGYTLEGNKCRITIDATAKTEYSCPTGYNLVGIICEKVVDATANKEQGTYSCPEGGKLYGTKCSITTRATEKQKESTYVCPYGSKSVGNKCEITIDADAKDIYSYTCPEGYTASGIGANTICSRVRKTADTYYCEDADATLVGTKCVKTIKGGFSHYSCPTNEYTLEGDKCTKKSVETIDATATIKNTTTYKYTWSTKSKLDGWEFTGETKTETSTYTAFQK